MSSDILFNKIKKTFSVLLLLLLLLFRWESVTVQWIKFHDIILFCFVFLFSNFQKKWKIFLKKLFILRFYAMAIFLSLFSQLKRVDENWLKISVKLKENIHFIFKLSKPNEHMAFSYEIIFLMKQPSIFQHKKLSINRRQPKKKNYSLPDILYMYAVCL